MKKFKEEEVFRNTIVAHPRVRLYTYNGKIYYADTNKNYEILNDFLASKPYLLDNVLLTEEGLFLITEDGAFLLLEQAP